VTQVDAEVAEEAVSGGEVCRRCVVAAVPAAAAAATDGRSVVVVAVVVVVMVVTGGVSQGSTQPPTQHVGVLNRHRLLRNTTKSKGSPYSIAERRVPELTRP